MNRIYIIITFIYLTGFLNLSSQNIQVGYDYNFSPRNESLKAMLYLDNKSSLFEIDDINPPDDASSEYEDNGKHTIITKNKKSINRKFIKNFQKKTLLYRVPDRKNKKNYINITETLENFNWQLIDETKTVIGYSCKKAVSSFRDKSYEVWYAPELKFTDGPWKFWGLPGLILEINSTDATFNIVATSLQKNDKDIEKEINFNIKEKTILWDDYKSLVEEHLKNKKKFIETNMSMFNENATFTATYKFTDPDLEVIVE